MDDGKIEIHRNLIENFLMRIKKLIKENKKGVLYSLISFFVLLILIITGIVYINSRSGKELESFEKIVNNYYTANDEKSRDLQKTVDELNRLIDSSIWGYVNENGYYIIGGLYFSENKVKEGKDYMLKYADKNSSSFLAPFALHRAAIACEKLNDIKGALAIYERLENKYKGCAITDEIYFDLGRLNQINGNMVKAKEYYNKVIAEFPMSVYANESRQKLLLSGFKDKPAK